MTVHYDRDVDALYISFSKESPSGAVEVHEGVNVDTTEAGCITEDGYRYHPDLLH